MSEEIKELFLEAIDELNEQLDDEEKIVCNDETRFIGSKACIDSITFVTLISIIEEMVEDKFDKSIHLVNEKAFSSKNSPFYSVETFTNYIDELLKEA